MSTETQDIHWLAFRYVSGELTADEEARFEQLLADDQSAREAVEQAVELHGAVRLAAGGAPMTRPEPVRKPFRRRRLWWTVGSSVCAVVAGLIWLAASREKGDALDDPPASLANKVQNDVALAWAEVRSMQLQAESDSTVPQWTDDPTLMETMSDTGVQSSSESVRGVPGWLLTAVSTGGGENKENK